MATPSKALEAGSAVEDMVRNKASKKETSRKLRGFIELVTQLAQQLRDGEAMDGAVSDKVTALSDLADNNSGKVSSEVRKALHRLREELAILRGAKSLYPFAGSDGNEEADSEDEDDDDDDEDEDDEYEEDEEEDEEDESGEWDDSGLHDIASVDTADLAVPTSTLMLHDRLTTTKWIMHLVIIVILLGGALGAAYLVDYNLKQRLDTAMDRHTGTALDIAQAGVGALLDAGYSIETVASYATDVLTYGNHSSSGPFGSDPQGAFGGGKAVEVRVLQRRVSRRDGLTTTFVTEVGAFRPLCESDQLVSVVRYHDDKVDVDQSRRVLSPYVCRGPAAFTTARGEAVSNVTASSNVHKVTTYRNQQARRAAAFVSSTDVVVEVLVDEETLVQQDRRLGGFGCEDRGPYVDRTAQYVAAALGLIVAFFLFFTELSILLAPYGHPVLFWVHLVITLGIVMAGPGATGNIVVAEANAFLRSSVAAGSLSEASLLQRSSAFMNHVGGSQLHDSFLTKLRSNANGRAASELNPNLVLVDSAGSVVDGTLPGAASSASLSQLRSTGMQKGTRDDFAFGSVTDYSSLERSLAKPSTAAAANKVLVATKVDVLSVTAWMVAIPILMSFLTALIALLVFGVGGRVMFNANAAGSSFLTRHVHRHHMRTVYYIAVLVLLASVSAGVVTMTSDAYVDAREHVALEATQASAEMVASLSEGIAGVAPGDASWPDSEDVVAIALAKLPSFMDAVKSIPAQASIADAAASVNGTTHGTLPVAVTRSPRHCYPGDLEPTSTWEPGNLPMVGASTRRFAGFRRTASFSHAVYNPMTRRHMAGEAWREAVMAATAPVSVDPQVGTRSGSLLVERQRHQVETSPVLQLCVVSFALSAGLLMLLYTLADTIVKLHRGAEVQAGSWIAVCITVVLLAFGPSAAGFYGIANIRDDVKEYTQQELAWTAQVAADTVSVAWRRINSRADSNTVTQQANAGAIHTMRGALLDRVSQGGSRVAARTPNHRLLLAVQRQVTATTTEWALWDGANTTASLANAAGFTPAGNLDISSGTSWPSMAALSGSAYRGYGVSIPYVVDTQSGGYGIAAASLIILQDVAYVDSAADAERTLLVRLTALSTVATTFALLLLTLIVFASLSIRTNGHLDVWRVMPMMPLDVSMGSYHPHWMPLYLRQIQAAVFAVPVVTFATFFVAILGIVAGLHLRTLERHGTLVEEAYQGSDALPASLTDRANGILTASTAAASSKAALEAHATELIAASAALVLTRPLTDAYAAALTRHTVLIDQLPSLSRHFVRSEGHVAYTAAVSSSLGAIPAALPALPEEREYPLASTGLASLNDQFAYTAWNSRSTSATATDQTSLYVIGETLRGYVDAELSALESDLNSTVSALNTPRNQYPNATAAFIGALARAASAAYGADRMQWLGYAALDKEPTGVAANATNDFKTAFDAGISDAITLLNTGQNISLSPNAPTVAVLTPMPASFVRASTLLTPGSALGTQLSALQTSRIAKDLQVPTNVSHTATPASPEVFEAAAAATKLLQEGLETVLRAVDSENNVRAATQALKPDMRLHLWEKQILSDDATEAIQSVSIACGVLLAIALVFGATNAIITASVVTREAAEAALDERRNPYENVRKADPRRQSHALSVLGRPNMDDDSEAENESLIQKAHPTRLRGHLAWIGIGAGIVIAVVLPCFVAVSQLGTDTVEETEARFAADSAVATRLEQAHEAKSRLSLLCVQVDALYVVAAAQANVTTAAAMLAALRIAADGAVASFYDAATALDVSFADGNAPISLDVSSRHQHAADVSSLRSEASQFASTLRDVETRQLTDYLFNAEGLRRPAGATHPIEELSERVARLLVTDTVPVATSIFGSAITAATSAVPTGLPADNTAARAAAAALYAPVELHSAALRCMAADANQALLTAAAPSRLGEVVWRSIGNFTAMVGPVEDDRHRNAASALTPLLRSLLRLRYGPLLLATATPNQLAVFLSSPLSFVSTTNVLLPSLQQSVAVYAYERNEVRPAPMFVTPFSAHRNIIAVDATAPGAILSALPGGTGAVPPVSTSSGIVNVVNRGRAIVERTAFNATKVSPAFLDSVAARENVSELRRSIEWSAVVGCWGFLLALLLFGKRMHVFGDYI